jgi:hypothetical protein
VVRIRERTHVGSRPVTSTLESVRFTEPDRVDFRLLRGPLPSVTESFTLEATSDGRTRLHYEGALETDLWQAGVAWGRVVAHQWNVAVHDSVESIRSEADGAPRTSGPPTAESGLHGADTPPFNGVAISSPGIHLRKGETRRTRTVR